MTAISQVSTVAKLKDEYLGDSIIYTNQTLNTFANGSIINNGFMGSGNITILTSLKAITIEAPGCIAAPVVMMVAKNIICLGRSGQGSQSVPVRLYAPRQLSITAKHLSIGDVRILVEPEHAFISCKKLTLSKSTEEEPAHFEIVKSWAINDAMEIEVISTTSKGSKTEHKEKSTS
jgi:hypothetical protein